MTLSPGVTRWAAALLRQISPGSPAMAYVTRRPVVDVEDVHLLVLDDVGEAEQHRIDRVDPM